MKRKIAIFTVLLLCLFTVPAFAHKPIFEKWDSTFERPVVIPHHEISYVVYGELQTKNDVDFVKFFAKAGDTFYMQMTIPIIKENEYFKPYIAIIGPKILERDDVPFSGIPESLGIIVLPPGSRDYFYEKFTQTSYYTAQSIRGQIPEDGDYYIAVYSKDRGGKYALAVGEKEKFGILDILKFPFTYTKVKCFFSPFTTILIIAGVILIVIGIIKFTRHRR